MLKKRINKVAKFGSSTTKQRASKSDDLQNLERIFELMEKHEVGELEWEKGGERLKLKTRHAILNEQVLSSMTGSPAVTAYSSYRVAHDPLPLMGKGIAAPSAQELPESGASVSKAATLSGSQKQVVSPFVGTFYRQSSPDADPYVKEGQTIKRGDVLCIIEAMKLMNEIEAEFSGKIISVLVENGQPVEFGEPLFVVQP